MKKAMFVSWAREANLGKVTFWQQLNKTRQKCFPEKKNKRLTCRAILLTGGFFFPSFFCSENDPCYYWKIFCWSDGGAVRYVSVCVMLSKGNRTPWWRVAEGAQWRGPRQIKSNSHLSCWHLKSHLSNYSWCPGFEIKPIISTEEQMMWSQGARIALEINELHQEAS